MPPKKRHTTKKAAAARPGWNQRCDHCGTATFVPQGEWWINCQAKECSFFVVAPINRPYMYVRINCEETTYERVRLTDTEVNCECCQESQKFIIDSTVMAEKMNGQSIYSTFRVREAAYVISDLRATVNVLTKEKKALEDELAKIKNAGRKPPTTEEILKKFDLLDLKGLDDRLSEVLKNTQESLWEDKALNAQLENAKKRCQELESKLSPKRLPPSGLEYLCSKIVGGGGGTNATTSSSSGREEVHIGLAAGPHCVMKKVARPAVSCSFSDKKSSAVIRQFVMEIEKTMLPNLRLPAGAEAAAGDVATDRLPTFEEIIERFPVVKDKWLRLRRIYWEFLKHEGMMQTPGGAIANQSEGHGDTDERFLERLQGAKLLHEAKLKALADNKKKAARRGKH